MLFARLYLSLVKTAQVEGDKAGNLKRTIFFCESEKMGAGGVSLWPRTMKSINNSAKLLIVRVADIDPRSLPSESYSQKAVWKKRRRGSLTNKNAFVFREALKSCDSRGFFRRMG